MSTFMCFHLTGGHSVFPHSSFDRWHCHLAMKFQISTSQDVMIFVPRPEGIANMAECHIDRLCRPPHQLFCAGTSQKKRFGVPKVFPLGGSTGWQTSAPTFLCRDQSKKALRGAESFSSCGHCTVDGFANLCTNLFVQGPVKKSASGCRKFFLLGPPEFPCPLRLLAQFVHGEGVFRWPVVAPSSPNPGGGISILGVHF